MNKKMKTATALLLAFSMISCDREKTVTVQSDEYKELYQKQLEKTNEHIHEYNALLEANQSTSNLLWETELLVGMLDAKAQIVLAQSKGVELKLISSVFSSKTCKTDEFNQSIVKMDESLKSLVATVQDLETKMMKENLEQLIKNVPLNIKAKFRSAQVEEYKTVTQKNFKKFNGIREMFLVLSYRVKERVNSACQETVSKFDVNDYAPVVVSGNSGGVEGTVFAQNGSDPVVESLIYIPKEGNEALEKNAAFKEITAIQGTLSCGEPKEAYYAKTCSDSKGNYKLQGIPEGDITLKVSKGLYAKRFIVTIKNNQISKVDKKDSTLPKIADENSDIARIVVINGRYDNLAKVLEKIGLHDKDGSQNYVSRDSSQLSELLKDEEALSKVDLLMINCGQDYEIEVLSDKVAKKNLTAWVQAGGRLFVTDQAYDFVEQLFPEAITFAGDSSGQMNTAQIGRGGVSYEASIDRIGLQTWLQDGVTCYDKKNCLLDSKKVMIDGFSSQWAKMDGVLAATDVWVRNTEIPLTVTFEAGKGKVFYSSYHTHHGESKNAVPQERILQYFVFDLVD
jgi:hypothetical protein